MKKHQYTGFLILVGLVFLTLLLTTFIKQPGSHPVKIVDKTFSQFTDAVAAHKLASVDITGNTAIGKLATPEEDTEEGVVATVSGKTLPALPNPAGAPPAQQKKSASVKPAETTADENAQPVADALEKTPAAPTSVVAVKATPGKASRLDALKPLVTDYRVVLPEGGVGVNLLVPVLKKYNVPFTFKEPKAEGQWLSMLTGIFLPILLLLFIFVLFRNAQGGGSQALSFGKSRAKMSMDSKVKITFNDVAGIDEAKVELEEVVDFLKNGERYQKLGAKIPKGVLLVGSPGTGKTLLAKAVAGEAGVPFFSISGSDFVEMFVGVGASRVRDLFEQAKKHAPCIIFMDEIDAVGRQRGAGMGGGHDEREQTLNQLLVEMDGFDPHVGIIVLAATNRPDILDNALLRPGRFDRQVMIDRPDVQGREQILKVHAKGKPLASDVDLKQLAKRTPGFTGADLANLLNEGALLAARRNKEIIHMADIEDSIDKVLAGTEKKNKLISEKDKEITAYHEVGHALVAVLTPGSDPLRKVTVIPRGMALGLTWTMPDDEKTHVSKTNLLAQIAMFLGGRVAEEVVFHDVCTGASNDLERMSALARKVVTVYGMNEKLGPITYGKRNEHMFMGRDFGTDRDYGEEVAALIDREVKGLVETQYQYVKKLLSENRDVMDAIVKVLLEKETLDDTEFIEIMNGVVANRSNGAGPTRLVAAEVAEERPPLVIEPETSI